MSSIGPLGGVDKGLQQTQLSTVRKDDKEVQEEPKDKVQISKGREIFEKVIGAPVALVTGTANVAGGFLGGGIAGASKDDKDSAHIGVAIGSGASYIAMGAGAGAMVGGLPGGIIGGIGGLVFTILSGASGSMEKIGSSVEDIAFRAVSDNPESGRPIKDGVRDFTEGAMVGILPGAVEGFKEGNAYGAGVVSGVIEGVKGMATSALGKYETKESPAETPAKPEVSTAKKVLKAVLGAPRKVVDTAAGLIGGVIGMGMEAVDGLLQGAAVGMGADKATAKVQRNLVTLQSALAGGVAGMALGGIPGAAIGVGCGLVSGRIINRFSKKTGTDKEIAQNLTNAVKYAQKDNAYQLEADKYGGQDKTPYESFRDAIEGAMTGTVAGAREGFKAGYSAGTGVVEGTVEGITGVVGGLFGGIKKD